MALIYTKTRSVKKKKPTKKELELAKAWEAVQAKHAKPLEKGAKANGLTRTKRAECKTPSELRIEARTTVESNEAFRKMQGSTAPRQSGAYTGTECLGVALMHKSNYTPVFQSEAAVDIAKMRR